MTWRSDGVWEVTADPVDWAAQVHGFKTVNSGDKIVFVTDGGVYHAPKDISLPKLPLVLKAKAGLSEKPLVEADSSVSRLFKFKADLTVQGLRFKGDGILEGTPYLFRADKNDNDLGTVIFEDCEFSTVRLRGIHMDKGNHTDTLIVNNCIFREIGESGIRGKESTRDIDYAKFTNNTFYKIGENGIYLRNVGELEVSHNTFFFSDSTISGRHGGGVRARDDTVIVIRDNIFAKLEKSARVSGSTDLSPTQVVEYNLFWDNDNNIMPVDDSTRTFPIFNFEADPMFKDTSAANLDLALEIGGPAIEAASDGTNLGDPHWGTWDITVGVVDDALKPKSYRLSQNYPNPFNPSTTIRFDVVDPGYVTLKVYNIMGQEVATLVDRQMEPGFHSLRWYANGLATGVYVYRITVNDFVKYRKLVIIK